MLFFFHQTIGTNHFLQTLQYKKKKEKHKDTQKKITQKFLHKAQ